MSERIVSSTGVGLVPSLPLRLKGSRSNASALIAAEASRARAIVSGGVSRDE